MKPGEYRWIGKIAGFEMEGFGDCMPKISLKGVASFAVQCVADTFSGEGRDVRYFRLLDRLLGVFAKAIQAS